MDKEIEENYDVEDGRLDKQTKSLAAREPGRAPYPCNQTGPSAPSIIHTGASGLLCRKRMMMSLFMLE
jgi:hypothetical protein